MKPKHTLPYIPLALASVLFLGMQGSRITGMGPGLLLLMIGLYTFPITAVLTIATAGKGNRAAAAVGVALGLTGLALCLLLPTREDSVLSALYFSPLVATVLGTAAGRLSNWFRINREVMRNRLTGNSSAG